MPLALGAVGLLASLLSPLSAQSSYLVRGKEHDSLRHRNYLAPGADAAMTRSGCLQKIALRSGSAAAGSGAGGSGASSSGPALGSRRLGPMGDIGAGCKPGTAGGGAIVTGDFDGDGRVETAWRSPGSDEWRLSNGGRLEDAMGGFVPGTQATVVGDFDGDGIDEIAWRRDRSGGWVVNGENGQVDTMIDGIGGIVFSEAAVLAGDFDCDGKDEIAWRIGGVGAWVVDALGEPFALIVDGLIHFDPVATPAVAGDFDGDGCDDLAWRGAGFPLWNVNSVARPLWEMLDEDFLFDPAAVAMHVGDFDGDDKDDIAWRLDGRNKWVVDTESSGFPIADGLAQFDLDQVVSVSGDFDGDGKDDLAWRATGATAWTVNGVDDPLWLLFDGETSFDASRAVHVGDFDGNGKDDVAWLYEAPTLWQVDTEGPQSGANPNNWKEDTNEVGLSLEMVYADVDGDGQSDDLVLLIHTQGSEVVMLYRPLSMAYFLKSQGMTVTEEFYAAMSPEQQETWYLDSQTPEQQSSFTKVDPQGANSHPNVRWNMIGGNTNLDDINEMSAHASWTVLTVDQIDLGAGDGELRVLNLDGGFFGKDQGAGFFVSYSVVEAEYSYGPVTGDVTIGEINGESWMSDSGFAVNAGVTLVSVGGQVGDDDESHVAAGVGFGAGAGVGGSWGSNDLYGANVDIKFLSLAVYVRGDDAEMVYADSKGWIVGAANDTSGWAEGAWSDTVGFFDDLGSGIEGVTMSLFDDTEKLTLSALHTIGEGTDYALKTSEKAVELVVDSGEAAVNTVIQGAGNLANDAADAVESFVTDTSNPVGATVEFFGGLF